MAVTGTRSEC